MGTGPLKRSAIFTTVLVAGLVALEWIVAHHLYHPWYVFSDEPELRYELRLRSDKARLDAGGRIPKQRVAGLHRIAILGDSVAWGSLLDADQSIPRRIEAQLNAGAAEPRFEVLNAAVGGYSIHQAAAMYRHRVLPYDPDTVVYLFYANDFVVTDCIEDGGVPTLLLPSPRREYLGAPNSFVSWWVTHSAAVNVLYSRFALSRHRDRISTLKRVDYELGARSLRHMVELAAEEGDRFVVFLLGPFAEVARDDGGATPTPFAGWSGEALDHMLSSCREQVIDVHDLRWTLRDGRGVDYHLPGRPFDHAHPNAEGARLMAAAIAEDLRPRLQEREPTRRARATP